MRKSNLAISDVDQNDREKSDLLTEPSLHDLYTDPTLHALLRRDNLKLSQLQDVIRKVQVRLENQDKTL